MTGDRESAPSVLDIFVRASIQASPRFAGSLQVVYEGIAARQRARVEHAAAAALELVPDARVGERMLESEVVETLVLGALRLASQSPLASKRRLLGRLVAAAVLDDAKVDRGQLLLGVLEKIEAAHARCLEDVARAEDAADHSGAREPTARGAEREITQVVLEAGRRHDPLLLHQLESMGLLSSNVTWDGASMVTGLTSAGRELLDDLREAGLADELDLET